MINLIASILLYSIAFCAKWSMDTLKNKFEVSPFRHLKPQFWDPKYSWVNKYKDKIYWDGKEAFPGSTTIFAWVTDSWHLMQFIFLNCFMLSVFIWPYRSFWGIVAGILILRGIGGLVFEGLERIFISGSNKGKSKI